MTEQEKPPLLSDGQIDKAMEYAIDWAQDYTTRNGKPDSIPERQVAIAQREADIKWMKEHCYLKAERELPQCGEAGFSYEMGFGKALHDMLKEVDGVAYRAVRRWE